MTAEEAQLREAEARIRQLTADAARREQERAFGLAQIMAVVFSAVAACITAAGALLGAGFALGNWLSHH